MATRKTQTSQSKPPKAPKTTPPSATAPATAAPSTASYQHPEAKAVIRPEAGAQTRFKKKKPSATWRYDSSLAPELQWDDGHPAREQGEAHIARIQAAVAQMQATLAELQARLEGATATQPGAELQALLADARARVAQLQAEPVLSAQAAAAALQALSRPFLNWAGKAEHLSFEVPTLPLFIHERLSTQAILDSVAGQRRVQQADWISDFFGHPERTLPEQLMKAYEHPNGWQNRMVLGDSLVVMNSLLHFENLGGHVQMIYIDPPYGVRFGSNFQPFVRKRDVAHNDDEGFTREPEMVKAYRDTWELGLHSYLTYLRDRLLLARELLTESGSVFVQISEENLHHVRELLDEVFGGDNCVANVTVKKTGGQSSSLLPSVCDYLLWYAKDKAKVKNRTLFLPKRPGEEGAKQYNWVEEPSGTRRPMTNEEADGLVPSELRVFQPYPLVSMGASPNDVPFVWNEQTFRPSPNRHWSVTAAGLAKLASENRLMAIGKTLRMVNYLDDYPVTPLTNVWTDTQTSGFAAEKLYVVQTLPTVIERCMLMTTDPGDLVLDPTCGSGTTAVVAESWGRRWITIDTSRVPLALARQRLLTSTFTFHELKEPARGPAGGFVYREKKNRKGEHVGGIVPHITLGSIANGEPPKYEVLVDRPEPVPGITRVCGPFVFEATIPTASNFDGEAPPADPQQDATQDFVTRMVEVLRASPVLHLPGGKAVQLSGIRRPAKTLYLSAEAMASSATGPAAASGSALDAAIAEADADNGGLAIKQGEPVALLFGPEHGAIAEVAVLNAWQEATAKGFAHLYVIGFAIEPKARQSIGEYSAMGMPTTYVQATPDILMGDLLKNMRSSQIFSVCGQPDVRLATVPAPAGAAKNEAHYQVTLQGLDVFDPVTMGLDKRSGLDVPAWFLDTDYNGLVFRVAQAFFPRTQAWDNLKRALKTDFDDSVWAHLAGDTSAPFTAGLHGQIAVKVIDDRGNELMVVKKLEGAT